MNETGLTRIATGITGLDTILHGGFFRGGLYIVQGPPGTGKTTLANQICFHHVANGNRAVYVTLLAEYHARMHQHLHGMSFFDVAKVPDHLNYISAFGVLREGGLQALPDLLRREIAAQDASVLILDGFATAQRGAGGDQRFNEFVHELQGIAIATDCTMFLLTSNQGRHSTPEYTIVDGIVELADEAHGWTTERTLQPIKLRGSDYLSGRHAFRITDDGLVVYPRTDALLARPTQPDRCDRTKLSIGVEQLDTMLGGGLPAASTTMVIGPTGIGKTTLGLQFLSVCSDAEPGVLFGFYETPARIDVKVAGVCRPLRRLIDTGVVEIVWQPPTDGSLDSYGNHLIEAVQRRSVRRLFVDGLGALRNAAEDPVRMGRFLSALTNELRVRGVTTLYTLEVADIIGPTIRAPISDLSTLAENLILMRFIELRSHLYRLISILKVRDSDFDSSLYQFDTTDHGLRIEASAGSAEAITAGLSSGEHNVLSGQVGLATDRQPGVERG